MKEDKAVKHEGRIGYRWHSKIKKDAKKLANRKARRSFKKGN